MKCIITADSKWAIGYRGQILVSIPADQRFFRDKTQGGAVVFVPEMIETFPGGQPVVGRKNIIYSQGYTEKHKDTFIAHTKEEVLRLMEDVPEEKRFCVGCGRAVTEFIDECDTVYVTRLEDAYAGDDYVTNLDKPEEWELAEESDEMTCHDIVYTRCVYRRRKHD